MANTVYVDLEIFAEMDDDFYLLKISKSDLRSLVTFNKDLVLRHWDGEKPVLLQSYGAKAVRTEGDTSEGNNLVNLSRLPESLINYLKSVNRQG